jgi:MFS family permease
MLLLAAPIGILLDRVKRQTVLQMTSGIGILAVLLSLAAFMLDSVPLIYVMSAAWGCFTAASNPAVQSILADSVVHGGRSGIYSIRHAVWCSLVVMPFCMLYFECFHQTHQN